MKSTAIKELLLVADAFGKATNRERPTVSTLVFNAGSKLDLLARGGDLNTASLERAMKWFSDSWPLGASWPEGIDRPGRTKSRAVLYPSDAGEAGGEASA